MTRNKRDNLLPLGVLAALLWVATSCGTQIAGDQTSNEVHAEARRVYESFAGTENQQNASLVVRAYAINGAMDACMDQRGYPEWDWSLSRSYAQPYDPLRPTRWFAELGRRVYSDNEVAMRDYMAAEEVMNSDEPRPPAYDRAILDCLGSTEQPSDADVERAAQPEETSVLIEAWRNTMYDAGAQFGGDVNAYDECMDAADLPVLVAAGREYEDIGPVMASLAGKAGPPPPPDQNDGSFSEAWKQFLAVEDQVIAADSACRKDVHDRYISELGPVIAEFESKHAAEIDRAQQAWEEIEERAAELGYSGQRGPLNK